MLAKVITAYSGDVLRYYVEIEDEDGELVASSDFGTRLMALKYIDDTVDPHELDDIEFTPK